MSGLVYPLTRYHPSPVLDLSSRMNGERLSGPALLALFYIAKYWKLRSKDVRQLLGGIANGSYFVMKKNPTTRVLDADKLYRISYLIGIYKALRSLHRKELADEWIRIPNTNRIFGGSTPLNYMIQGGIPAMQTLRRLLDARRTGA